MIFPWIDIEFQSWQHNYIRGSFGYYLSESKGVQIAPWTFKSFNTRSLSWRQTQSKGRMAVFRRGRSPAARSKGGRGCRSSRGFCCTSRRGWGGRKDGSWRGPEVAAERSPSTTRLRRSMLAGDLCTRTSKSRGRCTCNQLDENLLDQRWLMETEAAAARGNAGERRGVDVLD
jgi:hypothetical protein